MRKQIEVDKELAVHTHTRHISILSMESGSNQFHIQIVIRLNEIQQSFLE